MISYLLWRVQFEYKNVQKILGREGPAVWYFAYGANLDPSVLIKRKMTSLEERPFQLNGYRIEFCREDPVFAGMGWASAEPSSNGIIHGKLIKLSQIDSERMDLYEGVPWLRLYERIEHEADGIRFYFYRAVGPASDLKPSRKYLERIQNAYKKSGVELDAHHRLLFDVVPLEKPRLRPRIKFAGPRFRGFLIWLNPIFAGFEWLTIPILGLVSVTEWMIKAPIAKRSGPSE